MWPRETGRNEMYTKEFKMELVKKAPQYRTYLELAKEYGIESHTLRKWCEQYRRYGEHAFDKDGPIMAELEDLKRLQKKIEDLEEENAILKKAMAFFAKHDL
jgi:transposase